MCTHGCCCSVAKSCLTLCNPMDRSKPGSPSPSLGVCPSLCLLNRCCNPTISSSASFSFCLQSSISVYLYLPSDIRKHACLPLFKEEGMLQMPSVTILRTWFLTSCPFLSALSVSPFLQNLSLWTCGHVDGSALLKKKYVLPSPILSNNLASDSLTAKHHKRVIYSHCFQFFTSDSFSNSLHYGFSSHYSNAKDCDKVSNTRMPYNLTYETQPLTFPFLAIFSFL